MTFKIQQYEDFNLKKVLGFKIGGDFQYMTIVLD
jgi:hypothetical protein